MLNSGRAALSAAVCCCLGCQPAPAPSGPEIRTFDVASVASQALIQLDADGDGSLSREEAKKSPALSQAFRLFDKDSSGLISKEELSRRFQSYLEMGIALYGWSCVVQRGGRPVPDATVKLIPENFMASAIEPASGFTDNQGVAMPAINKDQAGAACGLYRIEIEDASGQVLRAVDSPLGQELAADNRSAETRRIIEITR